MCVISMVMDMGIKFPDDYWSKDNIDHFKDLTKRAQQFDLEKGLDDCIDPEKAKLLEKIDLLEKRIELMTRRREIEDEMVHLNDALRSVEHHIVDVEEKLAKLHT